MGDPRGRIRPDRAYNPRYDRRTQQPYGRRSTDRPRRSDWWVVWVVAAALLVLAFALGVLTGMSLDVSP